MTFDQILKEGKPYINRFGIVFTSLPKDKISVAYYIDSKTKVELIKPAQILLALFNSPDKVDFMVLYKQNSIGILG